MTEQDIISGLKRQDEKAFEALVGQWQDMVYNTVLGLVQHEHDADDLTQDVFISVYRNIGNFRQDASLKTWIYSIATNKSLDFLRTKKRRMGRFLSNFFGTEEENNQPEPFYHPGVRLDSKEDAAILFKAINRLPENQKAAFVLQKIEGLPVEEIAGILKISRTAAESLLARAKACLKKQLLRMGIRD